MIEERKEISGRVFALLLALLLAASAAVGLNTAFAPRRWRRTRFSSRRPAAR